jgi:drug/metabolite transporter (DMT)-like permease
MINVHHQKDDLYRIGETAESTRQEQQKSSETKGPMLSLKWIALACLIIQNSGLAVTMRYTFILSSSTHDKYITSTAVIMAELIKLSISLLACFVSDCHGSYQKLINLFYKEFVANKSDFLKLMVPSILYIIQNSLQYFSMQCLSAPVFQVLYQMKIITTAMFSVLILSKHLTSIQWISILALTLGVALVQLSQGNSNSSTDSNSLAGLVSVILGCLTSGFAGVYFEMVLKSSSASIWLRNIQLSVIGVIIGGVSADLDFSFAS